MTNYYRLMLGKGSAHAPECFAGRFVGTDFDIHEDLSGKLPDQWKDFNKLFIPVYLKNLPDKTKVGAGLACGALWTVSKGVRTGDRILCPDGKGGYRVGAEARPLLDLVLADRIGFTPTADRGYQLTVPVVFDRVLTAAVPDLQGLQDRVASQSTPSWNQIMAWLREMAELRETGTVAA